jgi:hypothetical protein
LQAVAHFVAAHTYVFDAAPQHAFGVEPFVQPIPPPYASKNVAQRQKQPMSPSQA